MANEHVEALLKNGYPCELSTSEILVLIILAYRYNTHLKKSYPGMDELIQITQLSRQSVERVITSLCNKGLVRRLTIGARGRRAEYAPVYCLTLLGESVSEIRHLNKKYDTHARLKRVSTKKEKRLISDEIESYPSDTISTISNHKNDKYIRETEFRVRPDLVNYDDENLFLRFKELLPYEVSRHVSFGKNIVEKLNELEHLGTSLEAVCEHLSHHNFSNSYKVGGLVNGLLDALIANRKGVRRTPKGWCGECSPETQCYEYESAGRDGRPTYECPECHPNQVELSERLRKRNSEPVFDTSSLFKIPD